MCTALSGLESGKEGVTVQCQLFLSRLSHTLSRIEPHVYYTWHALVLPAESNDRWYWYFNLPRGISEEHRTQKKKNHGWRKSIQQQQTREYFFAQTNNIALCLIWKETVPVFKDYNLRKHCLQKHTVRFNAHQGILHKDKTVELKNSLSPQQNLFFFYKL